MLMHINPTAKKPHVVLGAAFIVIALDECSEAHLQAYVHDHVDSSYCRMTDERMLQREWGELVAQGAALVSLLQAKHLAGRPGGAA